MKSARPGFFQDNNNIKKKTTKYSNKKVKIRNLLTNVSYRRYKPEDVEKTNFVLDVFSFLTQNLNPSGLERKLETLLKRGYIKMIWDSCVPHRFTKFIYPSLFKRKFYCALSAAYNMSKSKQYCYEIC